MEAEDIELTIPKLESMLVGAKMGPQLLSRVQDLMLAVAQEKRMYGVMDIHLIQLLECEAYLGQIRLEIYQTLKK